jgi:hypothetical protein
MESHCMEWLIPAQISKDCLKEMLEWALPNVQILVERKCEDIREECNESMEILCWDKNNGRLECDSKNNNNNAREVSYTKP